MLYYTMRALTHNDTWYIFDIKDVPVLFNEDEFALLSQTNSPRLRLKSILRGCSEYGLYEGDIIEMNGQLWLICYERGFYAINSDYVITHLYDLKDYKVVGDCFHMEFPIRMAVRTKVLFKYKEDVFRIEDIWGPYDNNRLILRSQKNPIPVSEVKQECCATYKSKRLFLGDQLEEGLVDLCGGRICLIKNNDIMDITGGNLNGRISRGTG